MKRASHMYCGLRLTLSLSLNNEANSFQLCLTIWSFGLIMCRTKTNPNAHSLSLSSLRYSIAILTHLLSSRAFLFFLSFFFFLFFIAKRQKQKQNNNKKKNSNKNHENRKKQRAEGSGRERGNKEGETIEKE